MYKKIVLTLMVLTVAAIMIGTVSAQTVFMSEKNIVAKHTFYSSVENNSASFKFAEEESMVFITKSGNITIDLIDWGKDSSKNAILVQVTYQNQSTLTVLERAWGKQVAEMQLAKNVHLTVGLTKIFLGSPTKFASISTSLWMQG